MARGAGAAGLSDELLESFCLIGPMSRCSERIASYRSAGVDLPILMPAIGPKAASDIVEQFGNA
ncbi:LLM class flavin-dependent oxidoreductase [Actinomycetospora endophytica]|uniref:LLM class flavin-dependent oxidoreductase n=1 Tax=Actinomycetospora endophytica TaxID=2291215 RepID=A0ABS8P7X6_9PSEU|nr:LLM class flavin-dependent oxidoreductase [Actinomycetospora endophytica]MCD2194372.1 LLM class flavin-dependent oxidoreductase [Actinomycetospora endophytica]